MAAFEAKQKEFSVCGIPRSGQHAIATWIMGNLPGPSLFINNELCIRPDYIWYIDGQRKTNNYKSIPEYIGHGLEGPSFLADNYELPTVFIIRDIKNHMASLIKHKTLRPQWDSFFRNWEQYARLATTDIKDYPFIVVPFSLWHCSRPLRTDLFSAFQAMMGTNLTYNDDTRKDVMESGGGSSFDGRRFVGSADKMKVLERYKSVKLPPIPENLLKLNEHVFGCIYD